MKRLRADDSVDTHVKVGHRQTPYKQQSPPREGFLLVAFDLDLLEALTTRAAGACCGGESHQFHRCDVVYTKILTPSFDIEGNY